MVLRKILLRIALPLVVVTALHISVASAQRVEAPERKTTPAQKLGLAQAAPPASGTALAYASDLKPKAKLKFREGDETRVRIEERLKLQMRFPQVEDAEELPSIRKTTYSWTERVETVFPDGSARIAATLDSFSTNIKLGEHRGAEEFFKFNSNDSYDLKNGLRDIRALPRAQFLGNTLRFTVGTDGLIRDFQNLQDFRNAAVGKGFEYEFVQAMVALADSLRIGQLLEPGFGAVATTGAPAGGLFASPYTVTEVPVERRVELLNHKADAKSDSIAFRMHFASAPEKIDYLEGIAFPLGLMNFVGTGAGYAVVKNGQVVRSYIRDSSTVDLKVDFEVIPEIIVREVYAERSAVPVLRGGKVQLNEIEQHKAEWKPKPIEPPTGAKVLEMKDGEVREVPGHDTGRSDEPAATKKIDSKE